MLADAESVDFDNSPQLEALRQRVEEQKKTQESLARLKRLIDLGKFTEHKSCIICLQDFKDSDLVTPLPCDKRHYFHSHCIELWS